MRTGHKLIYTTSFGFMDATAKVAKKYPNVMFEHATGYKRDKNLATYSGRFYEGRYIMGQIAAKMSKTGTIGYIGSFPIPEVVSGINAMMLGAQSVRPDMKVKIIWVNTWYDPGKEAAAARALADQGADILTQHTDSAAAMQFANERGILAFGQDSDMIKFGPKAQLTAIINNWTPYYVDRVKLALDKKWATGDVWGGLNSKIVQMAPYTNMPDDVKKLAMETEAAITAGKLHPFKCPVHRTGRQAGRVQGRRQSRRRADPQHELFHQGDRRQAAGEVRDGPSPRSGAGGAAVSKAGRAGCSPSRFEPRPHPARRFAPRATLLLRGRI